MTGWAAVAIAVALFIVVMGGLLRTAIGPLTDDDVRCSEVDEDLDALYGG